MSNRRIIAILTQKLPHQVGIGICGCQCQLSKQKHKMFNDFKQHRQVSTMSAWQQLQYGNTKTLTLSQSAIVPPIVQPHEVLIQVHAASVNPIDVMMMGGYGSTAINALRKVASGGKMTSEFPLILGRDFSGVVVEVGRGIKRYKAGDEVWGVTDVTRQGNFAQYTVAAESHISKKPKTLSHVEAASIPYVAMTTWAALCTVGGLSMQNASGKRIAVLGASGGLGTFAVQLLKSWNAEVTATCSTDAVGLVISLGADVVLDYKLDNIKQELRKRKGYDLILDGVGSHLSKEASGFLKKNANAKYITIANQLLRYTDQSGLVMGALRSLGDIGPKVLQSLQYGQHYRWAFFLPNGSALVKIGKLVDQQKIAAVVEKVFPFEELPQAFDKVAAKHNRGKTVIDVVGHGIKTSG